MYSGQPTTGVFVRMSERVIVLRIADAEVEFSLSPNAIVPRTLLPGALVTVSGDPVIRVVYC